MRAFAVAAIALVGCYHPTIPDGSFTCGPGAICPSGFTCNAQIVCVRNGSTLVGDMGITSPIFAGTAGAKDLTGLSGTLECSTKTGQLVLHASGGDTQIFAAGAAGFSRVAQKSGPTVAIWAFSSFSLPSTVTIKPSSDSDALPVFASSGNITVDGPVSWVGFGGFGGLANTQGTDKMSGVASGGGAGMNVGGGGGGGYGSIGETGFGSTGGAGGAAYGSPTLATLYAGAGGGGGGGSGGRGGNGGGAFAIIALGDVSITSTIDVSGVMGLGAPDMGGGGGGGSGGSILVSGAGVHLGTAAALVAIGGQGGQGTSAGGAGAIGRVFIAGSLTVDGSPSQMPQPTTSPTPLTAFP